MVISLRNYDSDDAAGLQEKVPNMNYFKKQPSGMNFWPHTVFLRTGFIGSTSRIRLNAITSSGLSWAC
jgi:hypothetical protein